MRNRIQRSSRKGVYEVVEEVVLFSVGVAIMIGILGLFNSFEKSMLSSLGESRLDAANKYVASGAIALKATNCTRCYLTLTLPPYIGGEKYTLGGSSQGKTVVYSAGKYMMEEDISVPAEGLVQSTYRALQVEYSGGAGKIKIFGVSNY